MVYKLSEFHSGPIKSFSSLIAHILYFEAFLDDAPNALKYFQISWTLDRFVPRLIFSWKIDILQGAIMGLAFPRKILFQGSQIIPKI